MVNLPFRKNSSSFWSHIHSKSDIIHHDQFTKYCWYESPADSRHQLGNIDVIFLRYKLVLVFKRVGLLGSRVIHFSLCRGGGYDWQHSAWQVYVTVCRESRQETDNKARNKKMQEMYQKARNSQENKEIYKKTRNKKMQEIYQKARNRQESKKYTRRQKEKKTREQEITYFFI